MNNGYGMATIITHQTCEAKCRAYSPGKPSRKKAMRRALTSEL